MTGIKRYFAYYWGAAICCLPLYLRYCSVASTRFPRVILFLAIGIFSLALFGIGDNKKAPIHLLALLGMPASFISIGDLGSGLSMYQWACISVGAAVFVQMGSHFSLEDEKTILNAIAWATLIQVFLVFLNYYNIDLREAFFSLYGAEKHRRSSMGWTPAEGVIIAGSFDNPNLTASLLGIGFWSLVRKGWLYFAPLAILALGLVGGMGGFLAVLGGLALYLGSGLNKKGLAVLSVCGLGILTVAVLVLPGLHDAFDSGGRVAAWGAALNNLDLKSWLIGKGVGWWASNPPTLYRNGARFIFDPLHNDYLEVLYAFGLAGLLGLGWALYSSLQERRDPVLLAIAGAIGANAFVHFTFHIAATACIGLVVFALLTRREA